MPGQSQRFERVTRPVDVVQLAAAHEGYVNVGTNADGVVPGLSLATSASSQDGPAFALAVVAGYRRRPRVLDGRPANGWALGAACEIPVDGPR